MNDERETRAAYRRELEHRINQRVAQTPQQGGNGNQPPGPRSAPTITAMRLNGSGGSY